MLFDDLHLNYTISSDMAKCEGLPLQVHQDTARTLCGARLRANALHVAWKSPSELHILSNACHTRQQFLVNNECLSAWPEWLLQPRALLGVAGAAHDKSDCRCPVPSVVLLILSPSSSRIRNTGVKFDAIRI